MGNVTQSILGDDGRNGKRNEELIIKDPPTKRINYSNRTYTRKYSRYVNKKQAADVIRVRTQIESKYGSVKEFCKKMLLKYSIIDEALNINAIGYNSKVMNILKKVLEL